MSIDEAALVELGLIAKRLRDAGEVADVRAAVETVRELNAQVVFARDLGCSEAQICFALGLSIERLEGLLA